MQMILGPTFINLWESDKKSEGHLGRWLSFFCDNQQHTRRFSAILWNLNCFFVVSVDIVVKMVYYIKKYTQEEYQNEKV